MTPVATVTETALVNGVWTGTVSVSPACTGAYLIATDANGNTGISNPFNVDAVAGPMTQFVLITSRHRNW